MNHYETRKKSTTQNRYEDIIKPSQTTKNHQKSHPKNPYARKIKAKYLKNRKNKSENMTTFKSKILRKKNTCKQPGLWRSRCMWMTNVWTWPVLWTHSNYEARLGGPQKRAKGTRYFWGWKGQTRVALSISKRVLKDVGGYTRGFNPHPFRNGINGWFFRGFRW